MSSPIAPLRGWLWQRDTSAQEVDLNEKAPSPHRLDAPLPSPDARDSSPP